MWCHNIMGLIVDLLKWKTKTKYYTVRTVLKVNRNRWNRHNWYIQYTNSWSHTFLASLDTGTSIKSGKVKLFYEHQKLRTRNDLFKRTLVRVRVLVLYATSTIFQLYRGDQFYWWRDRGPECQEKASDLPQVTAKLYHDIMLYRVNSWICYGKNVDGEWVACR